MTGTLYIIASPIGNPEDITLRALNTLKNDIDLCFCEDTRQTGRLLSYHNIKLPLSSLHAHTTDKKILHAIEELKSGKNIAYLSDCGTPSISDPGSKFVNYARKANIEVIPLPGASALATLVSVSGFGTKTVIFTGFLSKKEGKRKNELEKLKGHKAIIVIYESPHRIEKTLKAINDVFPDKEIIIGREMTKTFEEYISGPIKDIVENLDELTVKGEFSIGIYNN